MRSEHSRDQYTPNTPQNNSFEKIVSIDKEYAQMVLDAALMNAEKERLRRLIDQSLDERDKDTFMKLSERYKQLIR
ncbi:IDEAL domain-containing protein [Camelliibacillus cellulosilyticus]|uniref:IDEAL domain-containing protein n=1 Tax=Camelliibacillus cellulosilyticus TaxID=2174486 RepID=A0ABV9GL07_9BACL